MKIQSDIKKAQSILYQMKRERIHVDPMPEPKVYLERPVKPSAAERAAAKAKAEAAAKEKAEEEAEEKAELKAFYAAMEKDKAAAEKAEAWRKKATIKAEAERKKAEEKAEAAKKKEEAKAKNEHGFHRDPMPRTKVLLEKPVTPAITTETVVNAVKE